MVAPWVRFFIVVILLVFTPSAGALCLGGGQWRGDVIVCPVLSGVIDRGAFGGLREGKSFLGGFGLILFVTGIKDVVFILFYFIYFEKKGV